MESFTVVQCAKQASSDGHPDLELYGRALGSPPFHHAKII